MSNPRELKERRRKFRRDLLQRYLLPALSKPRDVGTEGALVFAPHQDDETLGCGGLIALKRRAGVPVSVIFLTDGSRCLGELAPPEKEALVQRRQQEALAALAGLGVTESNVHFLAFPDGELTTLPESAHRELRERIVECLEKHPGREIYVPHRRDSHPDHEATFRVVIEAIDEAVRRGVISGADVYEYPVWLIWSRNRLFVNLKWRDLAGMQHITLDSEALALKRAAMQKHVSQLDLLPPGFVERFMIPSEFFLPARK